MVVKMMKWRPSPSKKFEAKITLHQLSTTQLPQQQSSSSSSCSRFCVEIKWKGRSKGISLSSLRMTKGFKRNFTKEEILGQNGVVQWNEEFQCVCRLSPCRDGLSFHPWDVYFSVFNVLKQGTNNKTSILGTASLNLADFASSTEKQHMNFNIPLTLTVDNTDNNTSLTVSVILLELRNNTEEPPSGSMLYIPRSPCYGEMFSTYSRKASPIRVNIFKGLSTIRAKRSIHDEEGSDEMSSLDSDFNSPVETDSFNGSDEVDSEDSFVGKSFDYGTLAYANRARVSNTSRSEDEDLVYYSHCKSDIGHDKSGSVLEQSPKRKLIPWRKRKLSFKSPKDKGEPLLRKDYREDGGDDIDFDRRQLSSSDESTFWQKTEENSVANEQSVSEFGDDNFAVGLWEEKEIISRDGEMKFKTRVFFASIDQMNERAAGESACTALVSVIANWLQSNKNDTPNKSQLNTLIREGSLEWRNLCENETYRDRFPDKHFDLETIIEAEIRPLSVVPEKSFVGFFGVENPKGFDFLQGAMSFDDIWDEICRCGSRLSPCNDDPLVYIISWNDHFFVLKVERDAYYIIDTLGERLYEGCKQAFILKFDNETIIHRIGNEIENSDDKSDQNETKEVIEVGKESCKEYIKSFLAAIPIRELQVDLSKGLTTSTPLHQRLQIEFHYTRCMDQCPVEKVM